MSTCFAIIRNVSYRSRNDDTICEIAGVYSNLDKAIEQAWPFKFYNLPDGTIRLYDRDTKKIDMERDTFGSGAVGIIAEVA
jgi:hypothetical protein